MYKLMVLMALVLPAGALAEEARWELGLGATALSFPHYTGSEERTNWLLPFPYVTYESERFKVDRNAAHGKLAEGGRWRLELSAAGSLPVDSEDDEARAGMPDLDALGELGPSLIYTAWAGGTAKLNLELPVRSAWSTDLRSLDQRGWFVQPLARYTREWNGMGTRHLLEAMAGPVWADGDYHGYFYGVAPRYATEERPRYSAGAGYGGWRASLGYSQRSGRLWYGAFVRYGSLSGAAFSDSPLVRSPESLIVGGAVAWIFKSSE